jgi:RNA 2',3'-cyclic 3'-phosphodiesterase
MDHAHYFYAVELPEQVKEQLKFITENLKADMPFKTWVHPQDLHITLAFLGNADKVKMEESTKLIQSSTAIRSGFELAIDHLGIFGRKDSPRIFWAGVEESSSLKKVRETVFSSCLTAGFELEKRPFSPHITIARKWTSESPFTYNTLERLNPFQNEKILFTAERVVLYRTHLGKSPKYEPITIFPLASNSEK